MFKIKRIRKISTAIILSGLFFIAGEVSAQANIGSIVNVQNKQVVENPWGGVGDRTQEAESSCPEGSALVGFNLYNQGGDYNKFGSLYCRSVALNLGALEAMGYNFGFVRPVIEAYDGNGTGNIGYQNKTYSSCPVGYALVGFNLINVGQNFDKNGVLYCRKVLSAKPNSSGQAQNVIVGQLETKRAALVESPWAGTGVTGTQISNSSCPDGTLAVGFNLDNMGDNFSHDGNLYCRRFDFLAKTDFDYSLTNGGSRSAIAGAGMTNSVTATLLTATGADVYLKVDSILNSSNVNFLNTSNGFTADLIKKIVNPTEITTLNIGSKTSTPIGTYTAKISGVGIFPFNPYAFFELPKCESRRSYANGDTSTPPIYQVSCAGYWPTNQSAPSLINNSVDELYVGFRDSSAPIPQGGRELAQGQMTLLLNRYCDYMDDGTYNSSDTFRVVGGTIPVDDPNIIGGVNVEDRHNLEIYDPPSASFRFSDSDWKQGGREYWTCASRIPLYSSNDFAYGNYLIGKWKNPNGPFSDQRMGLYNDNMANSTRKETTFNITIGLPDIVPLGATGASPGPNAPVITQGINSSPGKYAVGSILSFKVQPQNIGVSFTSPDFQIKLQKKVVGASDNTYVDTGNTAVVSNGLNSGMTVDRTINYTSVGTDKDSVAGMEFRYCVDSTNTVNEGVTGEANNCSGSVTAVFEQTATVGSLACPSVANSSNSIDLTWTAVGGTNVSLFRGSATTPLVTFAGNSGTYTDSNLSSNTTYTYYLRNGNTSSAQLLGTASNCKTSVSGSVGVTISGRRSGTNDPYYSFLPLSIGYGDSIDISWTGVNMPANAVCTPSGTWTSVTSLPGTQNNVGPLTQSSYTYSVTCDGVASNILTVNVGLPSVTCSGVVSGNGELVTWTAVDSPAVKTGITYLHHWDGDESMSINGNPAVKTYLNSGTKNARVTLYATGNRQTSPVACPSVTTKPNLIPTGSAKDPVPNGPNKPVVTRGSTNPDGSYVITSTVEFTVQPKNVGAGFTGTNFNVKLQKKTTGTTNSFADVPGAVVNVVGGLPFASTTNRQISYVSSSGDTNATGYDFRYCVDLPPEPVGAVSEFDENDNCSGPTNVIFKISPPVTVDPVESVTTSVPICTSGSGKINVSWTAVAGADGYRVYRGTTSTFTAGAGTYLGQVTSGLTYADTGLTIKQPYYYKVLAYKGALVSADSPVSLVTIPSEQCPDLTAENVRAYVNGNQVTSAQIVEGDVVSFKADIKNIGGDTLTSFNNRFYVDKGTVNELNLNDQILNGLNSGQSKEVSAVAPAKSWTATIGTHSVIVCADRPPVPNGIVDEGVNESDASNCSNGAFNNFTVPPRMEAKLEVSKGNTNIWSSTAVVINYEDLAKLRWTITGSPTSCSLNTNPVTNILPPDYVFSSANNPKTIGPNLNGSKFVFRITCNR